MRKRITNNLALKILAFLIAAFLWLVVVNIDDPVDDKTFSNIPVQVTHEEVITDNNNTYQIVDNTQEINVTVTAQRSVLDKICLLYTSPSPRDVEESRMPSSA